MDNNLISFSRMYKIDEGGCLKMLSENARDTKDKNHWKIHWKEQETHINQLRSNNEIDMFCF